VEPNLRPSLEETSSYLLSYWLTISITNSPGEGPATAMIDVDDQKNRHIVQKKWRTGRISEEAQHLRNLSFMDGWKIYIVEQE
jgi:hypothetical protein